MENDLVIPDQSFVARMSENMHAGYYLARVVDTEWKVLDSKSWLVSKGYLTEDRIAAFIEGRDLLSSGPDQPKTRLDTINAYIRLGCEYEYQSKLQFENRPPVWILERGTVIDDKDGQLTVEGVYWDVSERVKYESALLDARKRLTQVVSGLDATREAIAIQSANGSIVYKNSAARKLSMQSDGSEIAFSDSELIDILPISQSQRNELRLELQKDLDLFGVWERTIPAALDDGQIRVYETKINRVPHGGAIFSTSDVTTNRKVELEEQKLRAELAEYHRVKRLGEFAAGIAHDFANIVSSIQAFADRLPQGPDADPEMDGTHAAITKACQQANELVDEILVYAAASRFEKRAVVAAEAWESVIDTVKGLFDGPVEFETRCRVQHEVIDAGVAGLFQVVMNLAKNARDSYGDRPGRVRASMDSVVMSMDQIQSLEKLSESSPSESSEDEAWAHHISGQLNPLQSYVCVEMEDDGEGITREQMARVLQPFVTSKGRKKGTGLGLASVSNVVARCEGAIVIDSKPGEGTRFRVYLPVSDEEAEITSPKVANDGTSPDAAVQDATRVLIVDDEEELADVVATALTKVGFDVTSLYSGVDALAMIEDDPDYFDIVVTDQIMPKMRGTELIEGISKVRPELPVIMCSAFSESFINQSPLEFGARSFIPKPITIDALVKEIKSVLKS